MNVHVNDSQNTCSTHKKSTQNSRLLGNAVVDYDLFVPYVGLFFFSSYGKMILQVSYKAQEFEIHGCHLS